MSELPDFKKIEFPSTPPIPLEEIVPDALPEVSESPNPLTLAPQLHSDLLQAVDLMKRMLVYNSKHRISANEVQCSTPIK